MYRVRLNPGQVTPSKNKVVATCGRWLLGVLVTMPADLAKAVRGCPQFLHST